MVTNQTGVREGVAAEAEDHGDIPVVFEVHV